MSPAKSRAGESAPPLLAGVGITKSFGGLAANSGIDFAVGAGELHAIVGENGAGKSTLVKIVCGLLQPDSGHLEWRGRRVAVANPRQARALGIGAVFQHFSLFEAMSVAENIALALPPEFRRAGLGALIARKSAEYGIPLDPDSVVADLSVGQRQRVEIVRCLLQEPRLLVMDEPTSVLTPQETGRLFGVLRQLAKRGCAVLFISHRLDEVKRLTSRATVLRGGAKVAEVETRRKTAGELAGLMVGAKAGGAAGTRAAKGARAAGGACLLELRGLSRAARGPFGTGLSDVSFKVHAGEVLGIAGVAGNGQGELMEALTGEWRPGGAGVVMAGGVDITRLGPAGRRREGLAFVPEERNGHAAVPAMTLAENALLTGHGEAGAVAGGVVRLEAARAMARRIVEAFDVRLPQGDPPASALSGGNLQKFVVGREIAKSPRVLVVAQPTWGVDVGAARVIRGALADLARRGSAVVVISQDLEEVFGTAHRIAVLSGGRLSEAVDAGKATAERVGMLMGGAPGGTAAS